MEYTYTCTTCGHSEQRSESGLVLICPNCESTMTQATNYFHYLGYGEHHLAKELPQDCIDDCSASGNVEAAVEHWVKTLGFNADPVKTKTYLRAFGAWNDGELSNHAINLQRLLWSVCCDIKEKQNLAESEND